VTPAAEVVPVAAVQRVQVGLIGVGLLMVSACSSPPADLTSTVSPDVTVLSTTSVAPQSTAPSSSTSAADPVIEPEVLIVWDEVQADLDGQRIRSVAATPAGFFAVSLAADGTDPRWWRSVDGTNWTSSPLDLPGYVAGQELEDLRTGGAGFLLAGTSDPIDPGPVIDAYRPHHDPDLAWLSSDGDHWIRVDPEAVAEVPQFDPSLSVSGLVVPVTVSDIGFLVRGGFSAQLDVEAFIAEWFPELEGTAYSIRPGAELGGEFMDLLIVRNEAGEELGRISGDDLGFPWGGGEGLLEGIRVEGLWFSHDGTVWEEVTTGPAEVEFGTGLLGSDRWVVGEVGPGLVVGCSRWIYAVGNTDSDPPEVRSWRSGDGLFWEELTIEGSTTVNAMTCIGEGAVAVGNDIRGHAVWIAGFGGGWGQTVGAGLGLRATPDLFGGAVGLVAGERLPQVPCVDEPCQFLPDIRLAFTSGGSIWSAVDRGSGQFGTNAMVRDIAVGGEQLVAVTEHPMEGIGQPGLDPTRIWVGTPTTRPAGTAIPEPELDRTVEVVWPAEPRSFASEPELGILIRVLAESPIDRVEVNGEPASVREAEFWGTDFGATVRLDPGLNTLDIALFGPGIEEHTFRDITLLTDTEDRLARVTAVTPQSITVDWIEINDSGEFPDFVDYEPGVLDQIPLSDDVVVILSGTAVPLRYFIDQYYNAHGGAGLLWTEFALAIHNGTVVQMQQIGLG
jgi:hypothetical protein